MNFEKIVLTQDQYNKLTRTNLQLIISDLNSQILDLQKNIEYAKDLQYDSDRLYAKINNQEIQIENYCKLRELVSEYNSRPWYKRIKKIDMPQVTIFP